MSEALFQKLTSPKDPEGDSHMSPATESSQGEDSDAMFPAANDAPSTLHTTSNEQATGELSPPNSQDHPDTNGDEAMDLNGGESAWNMPSQSSHTGNGVGGKGESSMGGDTDYVPGQSWDNPKAREDAQRQWNGLLDKNFSLSEWSPPLYFGLEMLIAGRRAVRRPLRR